VLSATPHDTHALVVILTPDDATVAQRLVAWTWTRALTDR
jgi:hypothetical protein